MSPRAGTDILFMSPPFRVSVCTCLSNHHIIKCYKLQGTKKGPANFPKSKPFQYRIVRRVRRCPADDAQGRQRPYCRFPLLLVLSCPQSIKAVLRASDAAYHGKIYPSGNCPRRSGSAVRMFQAQIAFWHAGIFHSYCAGSSGSAKIFPCAPHISQRTKMK